MARFFWVCLAGAMGTGARYIVAYAGAKAVLSPDLRVILATGFLGGLTTYSAFNWDTILLAQNGPGLGLVNLAVTLFGCLASGALGLALAHAMVG